MKTAFNPCDTAAIDWLDFTTPKDLHTFPLAALPIVMQSAIRDQQQEILAAMTTLNTTHKHRPIRRIAVRVNHPLDCLIAAIAVHTLGYDLFLCDPQWSEAECAAVFYDIQPAAIVRDLVGDLVPDTALKPGVEVLPAASVIVDAPEVGRSSPTLNTPGVPANHPNRLPYWAIPTGGTSGTIRFACHTWQTLAASAIGVRDFFQRDRLQCFCSLPVFHVSGLAQFVRSLISGGTLALTRPALLRPDLPPPDSDLRNFWLSLVPTQLQRLIDRPLWRRWLQQFEVIFLGGAPAWTELLASARSHGLRLAPTFGMTETASQVATLHPDDFLAGRTGCGRVLPHAAIAISPELVDPIAIGATQTQPQPQPQTQAQAQTQEAPHTIGLISIQARSLFHGYYQADLDSELNRKLRPETNVELHSKSNTTPSITTLKSWKTDDLGYIDAEGFLHIVGRASQKIITGGENVYPEAIEAAILATGYVQDVAVVGLPDREWGQIVVAVYVPVSPHNLDRPPHKTSSHDQLPRQIYDQLARQLARYKLPKRWYAVAQLPRNDRGKLDRSALAARLNSSIPLDITPTSPNIAQPKN